MKVKKTHLSNPPIEYMNIKSIRNKFSALNEKIKKALIDILCTDETKKDHFLEKVQHIFFFTNYLNSLKVHFLMMGHKLLVKP